MGSLVPASQSPGHTAHHSTIPPTTDMIQLVLTSLTVSPTLAQVNQEIYSETDLLAIDSESHNTLVIAPPPANFLSSNSVEDVTEVEDKSQPDGSHSFSYSLADGTKHSQTGYFTANGGYVMTGFWEYLGPDGTLYRTEFTADEGGYRPQIFKMKRGRKSRKLSLNKNKKKNYGRMTRKRKTLRKLIRN